MKKEEFEKLLSDAAHKFSDKKTPKRPETQFKAGAMWLWELLMSGHDVIYYEERLRADLMDREGKVDEWKESLITDTAIMMADRDAMMADINETGRLIDRFNAKAGAYEKISNPLYQHLKEKERSIGMQREHLGLSNKVNVSRIKESPKETVDETDPMLQYYKGKNK